jgi:hypothetical protein
MTQNLNQKIEVQLQVCLSKNKYRKISLGNSMNYIRTEGLVLAFIDRYDGTITYIVDKNDIVEFEFGRSYYNVIINRGKN